LKANASLGLCDVFARQGLGADVASAGELATALAAGFPAERIFVAGPYKSPETVAPLRSLPEAVVSIDSCSELEFLGRAALPHRAVLRLRPDFASAAAVAAGADSRFGVRLAELPRCREMLRSGGSHVVGFHIFAGSQVLDARAVVAHLQAGMDLARRAADMLGITPALLNLGGGFGIPYALTESELDLAPIGAALESLADGARPARIVLELGRYLVAQAGWYLTSVVGLQTNGGRPAVVVDGGTHQRADCCSLCLCRRARPPIALDVPSRERIETDVWGCLSHPADVLAESSLLPPLEPGNVLAFADAGAYGLWASPALFHGSPLPAEVAFDGDALHLMRERRAPDSILEDQRHVAMTNDEGPNDERRTKLE
jgi:diaminopimelate decarboxylase